MNARSWLSLAGLLGAALPGPLAAAPEPAAIVEEARGAGVEVQPLDYLTAGQVLHLGPQDEVILDYLNSCTREVIRGGTVTVGATESAVVDGRIESGRVPCDGRRSMLGWEPQTGKAPSFTALPKPEGQPGERGIGYTLYGSSPLVDLGAPGQLTIQRLDEAGDPIRIDVTPSDLIRGRFYDFAKSGHSLTPGAVYRASFGGRRMVIWIDALARSGDTPLLGRLLRL